MLQFTKDELVEGHFLPPLRRPMEGIATDDCREIHTYSCENILPRDRDGSCDFSAGLRPTH